MKTASPQNGHNGGDEPAIKRARQGVGSSVAMLTRHATDDFILILAKTKVQRLLPKGRDIFVCERGESLPAVFEKMVQRNVLSMPVLTQEGKYHGFFDMLDVVRQVTTLFTDIAAAQLVDVQRLFETEARFSQTEVHQAMRWPLTKKNPYHPILRGFSLFAAWELLALAGVHRVPVVDSDDQIVDIITQSMLIDFLWQNLEAIGTAAKSPVSDITSTFQQVVTISSQSKAIIGFQTMLQHVVSGLAVVDESGRLVDNLSLRDLKGIRPDVQIFWRLWTPISEFKDKVREEFPSHKIPTKPVVAIESDPISSILEKMATQHLHRVFVVDSLESMKPMRVITQTDILRAVLQGLN